MNSLENRPNHCRPGVVLGRLESQLGGKEKRSVEMRSEMCTK
jgi:hypothetical protein